MTAYAGVVRDETGLHTGLSELADLEIRMKDIGVHPDIAGFQDLAHAFDLKAAVLAARATLEAALERRETRGCHNRADHPELDEGRGGSYARRFPRSRRRSRRSCARCPPRASWSNDSGGRQRVSSASSGCRQAWILWSSWTVSNGLAMIGRSARSGSISLCSWAG
jgi:hypothetical protein